MGFPKYKENISDINYLLQIARQLNPFAREDEKNLQKDPLKALFESYNSIISDLNDLADSEKPDKDAIWEGLMSKLDAPLNSFANLSVEEINKIIEDHSGLKLWEFSQLAKNLKGQLGLMNLRGNIIAPKDNESEYRELSEKHNRYVNLTKNFDSELSEYDSYEAFDNKLKEVSAEEEKRKKEFEFYSKDPDLTYTKSLVEKSINNKLEKLNYEQAYNLYNGEYEAQKRKQSEIQKQISDCFSLMKKQLKEKDEKSSLDLRALEDTIKQQTQEMASLTKNVLATIDVGNIESKLSGDLVSIDDYFNTLNSEIKNRPIIAIFKSTRNEKKYQEKRKDYLQALLLQDQYKDGYFKLAARIDQLEEKYAKPFGKTLEEQIQRAVEKNRKKELESILPASRASDEAYAEFQQIKEDFIKLYSVKSSNKDFIRSIRSYESPKQFKADMMNIINSYEEEFLNPIFYNPQKTGRVLTENQAKINEGCTIINQNYSQMKTTKTFIQNCEAQIKFLNENKIDPALYDQKQVMDEMTLKKYEEFGIKPNVDLVSLYKQLQATIAAKEIALKETKKYEPLKDAYLKEKEYIKKYLENRQKATVSYNEIKGTTERMQKSNEKIITAWAEYKELQNKSNALKDRIFNTKNSTEKGNAETYKDILSNIAADLKHFVDIAKVGRDSIFKDSSEYTRMINSVKEILAPQKENEKASLNVMDANDVKRKLDSIVDATKNYLQEKKKQWRLFPSTQRITRLAFAGNLLACANAKAEHLMKVQAQMTGVKNENVKEYSRAEKELGKENIENLNSFFTEVVKPRAKAVDNQNNLGAKVEEQKQAEKVL